MTLSGQGSHCFETLDARMAEIYGGVAHWAGTRDPLFVHGRPGTGKGAFCRLIRESGEYAARPVQELNCGNADGGRQSEDLFGERGAVGKAALAGDGLLIVEEIGGMGRALQERLAEAVLSGLFAPTGSDSAETFKARLIATSSSPWNDLLREGLLSPRLARLFDGRVIGLPSLEDRPRDIPLLADFFIASLSVSGTPKRISPEVYHFLCRRKWEGNIRELKNFMTRLYYLSGPDVITVRDLEGKDAPENLRFPAGIAEVSTLTPMSLYDLEKKYILHMIAVNEGNKSRTARTLKISLKTLRSKLKEYAAAL